MAGTGRNSSGVHTRLLYVSNLDKVLKLELVYLRRTLRLRAAGLECVA